MEAPVVVNSLMASDNWELVKSILLRVGLTVLVVCSFGNKSIAINAVTGLTKHRTVLFAEDFRHAL